jgi:hypothetical protein
VENAIVDEAIQHIDARHRAHALAVYVALKRHAGETKSCYPGVPRICQLTGLSRPTVAKALRRLESVGVVSVDRNRKTSQGDADTNLYYLPPVTEWCGENRGGVRNALAHPRNAVGDGYEALLGTGAQGRFPKEDSLEEDPPCPPAAPAQLTATATATSKPERKVAVAVPVAVAERAKGESYADSQWEALSSEFSQPEVEEAKLYIEELRRQGKSVRYPIRYARSRILAEREKGRLL